MQAFNIIARASAKYVWSLMALAAVAALTYIEPAFYIPFLLLLIAAIITVAFRRTSPFSRRYLFILIPGLIITFLNDTRISGLGDPNSTGDIVYFSSVLVFILPAVPFVFLEYKEKLADRRNPSILDHS